MHKPWPALTRNAVAPGLAATPAKWVWSGLRAHAGLEPKLECLNSAGMHAHLLGKAVESSRDRHRAVPKYRALVDNFAPQNTSFLQQALEQQLHLDDPWRLTVTKVPKRRTQAATNFGRSCVQRQSQPRGRVADRLTRRRLDDGGAGEAHRAVGVTCGSAMFRRSLSNAVCSWPPYKKLFSAIRLWNWALKVSLGFGS